MGGACSPFIHCLVQPFIPCTCCWRDVDAGQNYGLWFLIYFFAGYWSSKVNNSKNSWLTLFFAIWRVSARSGCIGVVEAPRPIYKLFVYIAMHCAIHIVVFLFVYVWCLSKCTTCNRCIVRGEGGGVWAFIEVVEPSVMSWVSRPLPVVRLTGWFSDLLAFFLLATLNISSGTTVGKQYCG